MAEWGIHEFMNTAFNDEERKVILAQEINNSKDQLPPWSSAEGTNNTFDRVFLLSYADLKKISINTDNGNAGRQGMPKVRGLLSAREPAAAGGGCGLPVL